MADSNFDWVEFEAAFSEYIRLVTQQSLDEDSAELTAVVAVVIRLHCGAVLINIVICYPGLLITSIAIPNQLTPASNYFVFCPH